MACGLAMMIFARSLIVSLESARDTYYSQYRFADIFAGLKRAPKAFKQRLSGIPGVAVVRTRVAVDVMLDVPGMAEPATGRIISLPETATPALNRVFLREGRLPGAP